MDLARIAECSQSTFLQHLSKQCEKKLQCLSFAWTGQQSAFDTCGAFSFAPMSAGEPIAGAIVTLYSADTGAPTQLAEGRADDRGAFTLTYSNVPAESIL
jgi:hypothetical protein